MSKPIWPPPKPKFRPVFAGSADMCVAEAEYQFDAWYAAYIESLGPAVEMSGHHAENGTFCYGSWTAATDTHTALLIGIHPIKEETADDMFEELLEFAEFGKSFNHAILTRAREYLARKKKAGEK